MIHRAVSTEMRIHMKKADLYMNYLREEGYAPSWMATVTFSSSSRD